ncbi:MAG: hypothetical protein ABW136_03680 [Steroidobacteraceae bacterium]
MWRVLAFGLLAANLLFAAWALWVAVPAATTPTAAPAATAAPTAPPPEPPRCVRLGPFPDHALAATVSQRLTAAALTPQVHEEMQAHRDGFWVFITAADAATQRRTLQRLRTAGIQDAYAMPDDPQFRISLGIFSERQRADQRASTLRPLSLSPVVEEHFQERAVQWLDVPDAGDRLSASRLEGFGITDSDIGAFDCPPATPSAPQP